MDEFLKKLKIENLTVHQKIAADRCIAVFKVGSQLYGTNTPRSDEDYEGVYIEAPDTVIGRKVMDEVEFSSGDGKKRNTKDDVDCKLYSLRKFISLAEQNNPNKIECFFIPDNMFAFKTQIWDEFVKHRGLFVSKKVRHTFSGYAHSQKHKLVTKKRRLGEFRSFFEILKRNIDNGAKIVGQLDIYEDGIHKKYDKERDKIDDVKFRRIKEGYQFITYYMTPEGSDAIKIDEEIYNYGFDLKKIYGIIEKKIMAYGLRTKDLEEIGYDLKFASHIFRLYDGAREILETGNITYPCQNAQLQRDIKAGKYDLDTLLKMADALEEPMEALYKTSSLRNSPDHEAIHKLQIDMHLSFWRRRGELPT